MPTEDASSTPTRSASGSSSSWPSIRLALDCEDRLPEGLYLALNVSPAVLGGDELETIIARRDTTGRWSSSSPSTSRSRTTPSSTAALGRLRDHGVRVAVDDVGSGFASFRHVTRVNPEILKLDRTLVCGIDEDPVRQSLAAAIVAFARDVGAIVVSEGIENQDELSCLMELAVGCGQGFYLARPELGRVNRTFPSSSPVDLRAPARHTPVAMIVDCAVYEHGWRRRAKCRSPRPARPAARDGSFVWLGLYEPSEEEFEPSAASSACTRWPSRTRSTRTSARRSRGTATRC